MRKALASIVMVAFAGLLLTSLIAMFSGSRLINHARKNHAYQYPYFMAY